MGIKGVGTKNEGEDFLISSLAINLWKDQKPTFSCRFLDWAFEVPGFLGSIMHPSPMKLDVQL